MKVVLRSDVPNLGKRGDIRDVADGYARNFLLPERARHPGQLGYRTASRDDASGQRDQGRP